MSRRRSYQLLLVSCVVIGLPACGDGGEAGPATPTRTQAFGLVQVGGGLNFMHAPHSEGNMPAPLSALPEDIPYSHPLRAAAGQNLVFDVQDGPAGQRFVVMDGSWGDSELDGQIYAFSGIGLVDVEVADAPELESIRQIKLLEDPGFEALTEPAHVVLPAAFEAKILSDPSADYNFTVSLAKAQEVNTNDFVNAYIQYGFVNTLKDYQDAVGESLMARAAIIELLQSPIVHFIISRGGEVDYACELSYCVTGRLKGSDILALAQEPNVYRVEDGDDTLVDDNATAGEVNEGLQAQQFFDAGFVNDRATHPESSRYLAVFERRMLTEHDAWGLFNGSNSTDRLTVYRCRKRLCSPASPLPQNSLRSAQHPMSVLSNVIADARGGGAGHQTFLDRRGSAHATPRVFFYAAASVENQSGTIQAPRGDRMRTMTTLDHVIKSRLSEPRLNVLTMSASLEGADSKDVDCAGDTDVGNQMGTLYESGLLTFKSTGNIGPTSPESCTVTEPGTARGVFALGNAHIAAGGGAQGVRDAQLAQKSPQGGVSYADGRGRTIIDLAPVSQRSNRPDIGGGWFWSTSAGTSNATPVAAGAAMNLKDFYASKISTLIDAPGVLHALMLLMGDGTGAPHASGRAGFANRWGAGRLLMRKYMGGLDAPAGTWTTTQCVRDGEKLYLEWPRPISGDVDTMRAVTYFYEQYRQAPNGSPNSYTRNPSVRTDIDLWLETSSDGVAWDHARYQFPHQERVGSYSLFDEKERIMFNPPDGGPPMRYRFVIHAFQVGQDDPGCGPRGGKKVHFAAFWEDSDREATEGLPGIAPEPVLR